jgi:hypothetical protein
MQAEAGRARVSGAYRGIRGQGGFPDPGRDRAPFSGPRGNAALDARPEDFR